MEWQQSYHDLCMEISILELRLDDLEGELKVKYSAVWHGELPSSNFARIPLDKALMQYDDVIERIKETDKILQNKLATKAEMERTMSMFQGLDFKIAYMRDVEGMPLDVIADKLGYSFSWISKKSMRIGRMSEKRVKEKLAIS